MRKISLLLFLVFTVLFDAFGQSSSTVQPFEQGMLIQFPNVRDFTISSSEDEAYFTAQSPLNEVSVIMMMRKNNGNWAEPQIALFSGSHNDLEPFLSPDGLKLFFASNRPLNQLEEKVKDYDIWYVERTGKDAKWSNPKNMGSPVNTKHNEFYPAITNKKNLYFTSVKPDSKGEDDIYVSKWETDHYTTAVSLSDSVNSEGYEFNAYVAPDESFLIFSGYNREDGQGSGDLYISYQSTNGIWSKAQNLGRQINSAQMDYCPFVNVHTNTLYFTSRKSDVKTRAFVNAAELLSELNKYSNGFSRIYKVPFESIISTDKH